MARIRLALALIVGSACVADDDDIADDPPAIDDVRASISAAIAPSDDDGYNFCEHLPASGPCSLLCDRDALVDQYVPLHSCVVFVCDLDDGRRISVHACHPPD